MCKSSESCSVKVHFERAVRRAKSVDSHIEFLPSDEQRSIEVSLNHKVFWFWIRGDLFWLISSFLGSEGFDEFCRSSNQKNAAALGLSVGFDDPS